MFGRYVTVKPTEHMIVDNSLAKKLRINFNITFPALTCAETSIDAMDVAGDQQLGLDHDIFKTRYGLCARFEWSTTCNAAYLSFLFAGYTATALQ